MSGMTKNIDLPAEILSLPVEYSDEELKSFFSVCSSEEKTLFLTFLLTGFREQEVVHLFWTDINSRLNTIRVTAKSDLGFFPKRWEEREVPVPKQLIEAFQLHPHFNDSRFVFPSPRGNRELHMLDRCKAIAERAKLNPAKFDLKNFRSSYATKMLRGGFDVRTVQHWMGHKSLETTMRYLAPARDVQERIDKIQIVGILEDIAIQNIHAVLDRSE
jgi:integrase